MPAFAHDVDASLKICPDVDHIASSLLFSATPNWERIEAVRQEVAGYFDQNQGPVGLFVEIWGMGCK